MCPRNGEALYSWGDKLTLALFVSLQRFPLGGDDEVMSSTLQQFAKVIDEVRQSTQAELDYPLKLFAPSF